MALDLEFLKKEYDEALKQTGGRDFWSPRENANLIRILPQSGGKLFYKKIGVHYGLLSSGLEICPQESLNKLCPVCEVVKELYKLETPEAVRVISSLRVQHKYLMNILALDSDVVNVVQFISGVKVWRDVLSIILDPDYGDITDVATGRNVVIEKIVPPGNKLKTEYKVRSKPDRTKISEPAILNAIPDLDEFLQKKVKSYDSLLEVFVGGKESLASIGIIGLIAKYSEKKTGYMTFDAVSEARVEKVLDKLTNGAMNTRESKISEVKPTGGEDAIRDRIKELFKSK